MFCDRNSKIITMGFIFCINGHYLIVKDGVKEVLQPKSTGKYVGVDIYRLNSKTGKLCTSTGGTI